jgi:hypothetical protein
MKPPSVGATTLGQLFQAIFRISLIAVGTRPFLGDRDYSPKQMALQQERRSGMDWWLAGNWVSMLQNPSARVPY